MLTCYLQFVLLWLFEPNLDHDLNLNPNLDLDHDPTHNPNLDHDHNLNPNPDPNPNLDHDPNLVALSFLYLFLLFVNMLSPVCTIVVI